MVSIHPFGVQAARTCHSMGTLIVPTRRSATFWPVLCPNGVNIASFVQAIIVLPGCKEFIVLEWSGSKLPVDQSQVLTLPLAF